MLGEAFIQVTSVSFGQQPKNKHAKYFISLYNPVTGKSSKFYTFNFSNRDNLKVKFSFDLTNSEMQYVTLLVHQNKFIKMELLGKINVPINAFPANTVCHETIPCSVQKDETNIPSLSISFDFHLNTNKSLPFNAKSGISELDVFDTVFTKDEHSFSESPAKNLMTTQLLSL